MQSAQRSDSRAAAVAQTPGQAADGATDALRARAALAEYHEACSRANGAPIGSLAFREAMAVMQSLAAELEALEVDPSESWREGTRRKLRLPVPAPRPGPRARSAMSSGLSE